MSDSWHLRAPDFAALDTVARRTEPFVLWPVGSRPLLDLWMDEAVRLGYREVHVLAVDRPSMIRDYLAGGDFWSCRVIVITRAPEDWPPEAQIMDHIPGQPRTTSVETPSDLIRFWCELNITWAQKRPQEKVTIDRQIAPGGWVAPQAKIHPTAVLTPPYWIGAGTEIGAQTHIGPNAVIGPASVIDNDAEISEAVVLAETYVGQHVSLHQKMADGGILLDVHRGCRIEIGEEFIISPLSSQTAPPSFLERITALALGALGSIASLFIKDSLTPKSYLTHRSAKIDVKTGRSGPLIVRRRHWLYQVALGHWHLIGVLPRSAEDVKALAPDVRDTILKAPTGVFSLADMHDCHDVEDNEEWIHALFQTTSNATTALTSIRRKLWHLAWTTP